MTDQLTIKTPSVIILLLHLVVFEADVQKKLHHRKIEKAGLDFF